jgi:hypothetical protein
MRSENIMLTRRSAIMTGMCAMFAAVASRRAHAEDAVQGLALLKRFIGEWVGEGQGQPGVSAMKRSYAFILQDRFIEVRNESAYAPQPKNPKGELHRDIGYFSFDKSRKRIVLRQFHVEGFVNQYVAQLGAKDGSPLVFDSEAIENIPAGFRARETYEFLGDDRFTETFELSEPGKEFEVYSRADLRRA